MLKVENVSGGYDNEKIIKNIHFSVEKGEFFGILGPNGSGKTTLLKLISGLLELQQGEVKVSDISISDLTRKQLAKKVAVLPQLSPQVFPYTVKETVSLGRYAHHRGFFQTWTDKDENIVQKVMKQTNISQFQDDSVMEHSGGEQQRIFLAQALVQQPEILLLDEPTNHLDLAYQKELLDLLRKRTNGENLTVVAILHDLNLASLYCDRLLLMDNGEARAIANPNDVLSEELINAVYHTEVIKQPHSKVAKPQLHLMPSKKNKRVEERVKIDKSLLSFSSEYIVLQSKIPLKTVSSGVVGAGVGWYSNFVNRHVDTNYDCTDHRKEMQAYLTKHGFPISQTVGMMTAVTLEDNSYCLYEGDGFSVMIVVTAGIGNAVDSTRMEWPTVNSVKSGTINTWIFVSGKLTDEAYIQSMVTATEAKTQVLRDFHILDTVTNRQATGTSTDSILVAATQQGKELDYAGTATEFGHLIGKGVYQQTKQSIKHYFKRKETYDYLSFD
ncbi:adenosylcobinamide amidohydrolase [Tetragenococcus halophilus]|uniref:adenosylcobinamide amidohydrolase n=1 Tax=Tetragenococcus halophilus TaxID=51669 RepID=UPI00077C2117|nr:adenosylcobinamide amidohydrolase [Tetragenococcus halophilus]